MSQNSFNPKQPLWRRIVFPVLIGVGAVGLYFVVQILLQLLAFQLAQHTTLLEGLNEALLNTILLALSWTVTLALVVWFLRRRSKTERLRQLFALGRPGWLDFVLPLPLLIASLLLAGFLASLADQFLPGFDLDQAQDIGFSGLSQPVEYVAAFVALVVIAPVAEELLFRGYIYSRFKKYLPTWLAVMLVSVLFGAAHLQLNVAIATSALSIFLVLARELTGSIWASIMIHMLKNGLAYYLLFINPTLTSTLGA